MPSSMLTVLKFAKKLMSKSSASKFGICQGGNTHLRNDAAEKCPYVKRLGLGDVLPSFLGGTAKCPAFLDRDEGKDTDNAVAKEV